MAWARATCCAPSCRHAAGIAGAVVLPVAGVVGGAVQVGRGIANQSEAIQEQKKGRVWNKVRPPSLHPSTAHHMTFRCSCNQRHSNFVTFSNPTCAPAGDAGVGEPTWQ